MDTKRDALARVVRIVKPSNRRGGRAWKEAGAVERQAGRQAGSAGCRDRAEQSRAGKKAGGLGLGLRPQEGRTATGETTRTATGPDVMSGQTSALRGLVAVQQQSSSEVDRGGSLLRHGDGDGDGSGRWGEARVARVVGVQRGAAYWCRRRWVRERERRRGREDR